MLTLGSLCTGIGGLERGLRLAGWEFTTEFVTDIDLGCSEWLKVNEEAINLGDFTKLDRLPETDILVAGFPCQPLSNAGKKKGTADDRWLWRDIYALLVRADKLPVLFLENVRALLTANAGAAFAEVCHSLDTGWRRLLQQYLPGRHLAHRKHNQCHPLSK
jgi:DNA (cytosine-5)-methyltransferase 1